VSAPRVVVAHPFPDVYGADRVMLDSLVALRDAGMALTVVLPEPGPMTSWLDEHGFAYRCVGTPVLRRALLRPAGLLGLAGRAPRHMSLIARTLAELEADLVYANTITLPHWVLGARRARLPVVVHAHESDARIRRIVAAGVTAPLLAADRVICVSQASKAFLCGAFPRLERRSVVVYNGIPAPDDDFPPPLEGRPVRLAVIGRLGPNKGQDLAVAGLDALVRRGQDVRLELVGDTFAGYEGFERELRETVRDLGLDERVSFAGFCSDIWSVLRRTDVVLAPSRTDSLPLVVIEAMLARRPVIAARVGGIPELIDDGVTGSLVPAEDVPALVARTEAMLDDRSLARRLGDQARQAAVERFGRDRFRAEIVDVVGGLLARTGRAA
jgi:glycosyltransferase involved in cell wall biosynthesis